MTDWNSTTRGTAYASMPRRAGGVYVVVLAMTLLITVIGLGALATARVTSRATNSAIDWQQTDHIAMSAVEQAISRMNAEAAASPSTWRTPYSSGGLAFDHAFGPGQLRWVVVDEDDGSISNNYCDPIRLYGVGRVGATRRCYSVQLVAGGDAMDFLRTGMHSSGGITLGGSLLVMGGAISTNGDISGTSSLKLGTMEVAGGGASGSPAPSKPMPSSAVFNLYYRKATVIPSSAASSGTFQASMLSSTNNPFGTPNPEGVYYLRLPSSVGTLKVLSSHIKATLLIENAEGVTGQVVQFGDTPDNEPIILEPPRADYATLITRGIDRVRLNGSKKSFDEGGDSYPSEMRGLIHAIGTTRVELGDALHLRGCLVAEGLIDSNGSVGITIVPSLYTNPPWGYTKGNRMIPVPGTWKWDAPPSGS